MNFAQTVLLGAIAGFTIYLGLPLGRVERTTDQVRAFLTMLSAGILIFLFFDIFLHIKEPIEEVVKNANVGQAEMISAIGLLVVFVIGFGIGLVGLVVLESRLLRFQREPTAPLTPMRLAMLIAIGLGLHNLSEGLAIGQSAGGGQISLALLLIVGFGLHNATEGFGIVGPLAGTRPSWMFLGMLGLIGGRPTFLGTIIGYQFVSTTLSVLFLALAAGAILYVWANCFMLRDVRGLSKLRHGACLLALLELPSRAKSK